MCDYVVEMK